MDDAIADILRQKTGEQKIQMVASGWTLLRAMHAFQVRTAHPDWAEDRLQIEVSKRMANGTT